MKCMEVGRTMSTCFKIKGIQILTAFIVTYSYLPKNKDFFFPNTSTEKWGGTLHLQSEIYSVYVCSWILKAVKVEPSYIQENTIYDADTG
jgi:hypothetical protein